MNEPCNHKIKTASGVYRCEATRGHLSVHFNSKVGWWPNHRRTFDPRLVGWLVVGAIILGAVVWLIRL